MVIFLLYVYARPLSVHALFSRLCLILHSSCYNSSLVTWTVVSLTAAKFKFMCSVSGFTFSCLWFYIISACCLHNFIIYTYKKSSLKVFSSSWISVRLGSGQWCGEPCFACTAVTVVECLPQFPMWSKLKLLWNQQVLCGRLAYC
jgi:hypothetical protein